MRKVSPDAVRDDFLLQLEDLRAFYITGLTAFSNPTRQSTLTEHSLLSAAVIWEGFVSDMFIAYINRDATRFKQHLKDSFEQHLSTSSTPQRVFQTFGTLEFPKHLRKSDVLALANNIGNNVTFPDFERLEKKAATWLIPAHVAKFSGLTAQQKAIINSVIALRNHVAHRSQRSLDAMNDVLAHKALHPTGIQRLNNRFHNVGAWLKATPAGHSQTRFCIIMDTLAHIGRSF